MITDMEASLKPSTTLMQRLLFRFAHPMGPTWLFGPIVLLLVGFSLDLQSRPWTTVALSLAAGMFSWTLVEYFLHRFVFHLVQVKEPWKTLASGLHMAHHRDTEAKDLIIAPPFVSIVFSSIIFLILWAITRDYTLAMLLEAGVYIGYILYEWAHYGSHQYHPKNSALKYLKRYHLQHHFKDPNGTFGVTTPMWDYIFGSWYRPKKI
ncbi:MAG: sterol desaturase family protein [Deltaproteobacteria bacterium]|nr:sterol desaturase family protein [Deltaproteobacteria bacterium]